MYKVHVQSFCMISIILSFLMLVFFLSYFSQLCLCEIHLCSLFIYSFIFAFNTPQYEYTIINYLLNCWVMWINCLGYLHYFSHFYVYILVHTCMHFCCVYSLEQNYWVVYLCIQVQQMLPTALFPSSCANLFSTRRI